MQKSFDSIARCITEFVESSPGNAMPAHGGMRIYDAPLVAVAAACDPLFSEFQQEGVVGAQFIPPEGWLPGAKSVISYYLPFTREIRESNRKPGLPSEEWVSSRIDGEAFNNEIRRFLVGLLQGMGFEASAPCIDPRFRSGGYKSNWSERHVGFAAGLGTFGLHRGLITSLGCAGRLGSVVTTMELPATPRAYTSYDEYCLYLRRGTCGACIRRCPSGSIKESGKDKAVCSDYMDREVLPLFAPRYGCAKCYIGVPCEYGIPK